MTDDELEMVRILAESHWEFLERWFHLIFADAFAHGWKHGQRYGEEKEKSGVKDATVE